MQPSRDAPPVDTLLTVGHVCGAYGIKGWLRVRSDTDPRENIVTFPYWWLCLPNGFKKAEIAEHKWRPQGLVVSLSDIGDRNQAEALGKIDIAIERAWLPALDVTDYYWHQLIGKRVVSDFNEQRFDLGVVSNLLATGANDVLVVKPDVASLDDKERLLPFVVDRHVIRVDLDANLIVVDWDPAF